MGKRDQAWQREEAAVDESNTVNTKKMGSAGVTQKLEAPSTPVANANADLSPRFGTPSSEYNDDFGVASVSPTPESPSRASTELAVNVEVSSQKDLLRQKRAQYFEAKSPSRAESDSKLEPI
jgi:hypothetical protein